MGFIEANLTTYMKDHNIFVETGTYLGAGLTYALQKYDWKKLYSCELLKSYYDDAVLRFPEVEIYHAKSTDFLETILPSISKEDKIVFWLDAHLPGLYSNISITDNKTIFPLEDELDIIYKYRKDCKDTIICDDLRIYIKSNFEGGNIDTPIQKNFVEDFPAFTQWNPTHELLYDLRNEGYLILNARD